MTPDWSFGSAHTLQSLPEIMRKALSIFVAPLLAAFVFAQVPSERPNETKAPAVPPKQAEAPRPLTAEDLEPFIDGLVPISHY
jgi:hypothetical protein